MGTNAGKCITSGCYNVIFGESAGRDITFMGGGKYNIAIGQFAGLELENGRLTISSWVIMQEEIALGAIM